MALDVDSRARRRFRLQLSGGWSQNQARTTALSALSKGGEQGPRTDVALTARRSEYFLSSSFPEASVMSLPTATAECSLYKSTRQYRAVVSGIRVDGGVHLAASCVEDCIRDCMAEGGAEERECRVQCVVYCRERHLPQCGPGRKLCRRLTTGQPECCPENDECCTVFDWSGTIRSQNVCCPPGQVCCHGNGCYVPGEAICSQYALCALGQTVCGSQCCDRGERCVPSHGCIPADAVVCNGQPCAPGELCTPQGCCPPSRTTRSGNCCPPSQVSDLVEDKCCEPGWSRTHQGCCPPGECCETVRCPQGKHCCQNLYCCNDGDDCTTDPDNPCRTPFT